MRTAKKVGLGLVAALLLQTAVAEPAIKVAVVNFQKAINEVAQGKRAKENLKSEFDARQKKLTLQQDQLKKLREELDKKRLVTSAEELKSQEESFNAKLLELQNNFAAYRQEMAQKETQFTSQILVNLKDICLEIGQKEGFTLVVENSQEQVIYAQGKEDITDKVIKVYNSRFKGPLKGP